MHKPTYGRNVVNLSWAWFPLPRSCPHIHSDEVLELVWGTVNFNLNCSYYDSCNFIIKETLVRKLSSDGRMVMVIVCTPSCQPLHQVVGKWNSIDHSNSPGRVNLRVKPGSRVAKGGCVSAGVGLDLEKLSQKSARDCSESSISRKQVQNLRTGRRIAPHCQCCAHVGWVGVALLLCSCHEGLQLEVAKRIVTAAGREVFEHSVSLVLFRCCSWRVQNAL